MDALQAQSGYPCVDSRRYPKDAARELGMAQSLTLALGRHEKQAATHFHAVIVCFGSVAASRQRHQLPVFKESILRFEASMKPSAIQHGLLKYLLHPIKIAPHHQPFRSTIRCTVFQPAIPPRPQIPHRAGHQARPAFE